MLKRKQTSSVILLRAVNNIDIATDVATETAQIIEKIKPQNHYGLCPICIGDLSLINRLHTCTKCNKHYVRLGKDGELLDIILLPYGYCQCCDQAFPLIKIINTENLLCPVSKEKYLFSAKGYLRASELAFGLCLCCRAPNPLVVKADRSIYCPVSNEEYIRNIDGSIVRKPEEIILPGANDIEAALNEGTAAFYYGGFIGTQEPEPPAARVPKRRRR